MKMYRSFSALLSWTVAFVFCGPLVSADSAGQRLYVVSGTLEQTLSVRVYALDSSSASPLKMVCQVTEGLNSVLADYEGRRMVLASPALKPSHFSFINMDEPCKVASREFQYSSDAMTPGGIYLLSLPDTGIGVALALDEVTIQGGVSRPSALTFVGRDASGPPVPMPFEMLRYIRAAGEPGVVFHQWESDLRLVGDPLNAITGLTKTSLGIAGPPYMSQGNPNASVVVANDDTYMVTEPYAPLEAVVDVLTKSTKTWRRVPLPFAYSRLRTFGHWLAAIEARKTAGLPTTGGTIIVTDRAQLDELEVSPGAAKRRSEQIAPAYRNNPAETVDDLFTQAHMLGNVFPGELAIYNLVTDVQLRISTGSGDSEVIFADDTAVFYRVDDAIFRRDIHGAALGQPVKLAQGTKVVQVH